MQRVGQVAAVVAIAVAAAVYVVAGARQHGAEFAVLEQILFEFGEYVLAIGELAQRVNVRPNLVHEGLALRRLRHVNHLLHHVVGVLVLHHRVQRAVGPSKFQS